MLTSFPDSCLLSSPALFFYKDDEGGNAVVPVEKEVLSASPRGLNTYYLMKDGNIMYNDDLLSCPYVIKKIASSSSSLYTISNDNHLYFGHSFTPIAAELKMKDIAVGEDYILALDEEGRVLQGRNGDTKPPYFQLVPFTERVIAVACQGERCIALTEEGEVYVWLKDDDEKHPTTPSFLSSITISLITCTANTFVAVSVDGDVYAWNEGGQLQLPSSLKKVVAISACHCSVALLTSNSVWYGEVVNLVEIIFRS